RRVLVRSAGGGAVRAKRRGTQSEGQCPQLRTLITLAAEHRDSDSTAVWMNVPGVAAALPAVHKPCALELSNKRSVRRRIRLSICPPSAACAGSCCGAAVPGPATP